MIETIKIVLFWSSVLVCFLAWAFLTSALQNKDEAVATLMALVGVVYLFIAACLVIFLKQFWALVLFVTYLVIEAVVLVLLLLVDSFTGTAGTIIHIALWGVAAAAILYFALKVLFWYFKLSSK